MSFFIQTSSTQALAKPTKLPPNASMTVSEINRNTQVSIKLGVKAQELASQGKESIPTPSK